MITFRLSLLLAFSLKEKSSKKDKVVKDPGGKTKPIADVKDPPDLIRLEKNLSTAHIEYELIPGRCKYQVDVLCWAKAAKIYFPDGIKMFTTISKNGLTFVPVCIKHELKEMSTEELVALQSSVIEFNVYTDKAKLGNAAKANKTEIVYIKQFDCSTTDFVEAYTEKYEPTKSATSYKKIAKTNPPEDIVSQYTVGYTKNETFSQMDYDDNFGGKIYDIIEVITNENHSLYGLHFTDFARAYNPNDTQGKKAAKKDAEGKKPKVEKFATKLTAHVQGEIFFTDPTSAIFRMEHHKCEVAKFFVVLRVEDLLTRTQKITLNPIVIKMKHISHFPIEVFEDTGITDVYCTYSIPCIAECKTIQKPISRFIPFNESHIYFTHTLSKIKLLEFLESKRLVVEVYGVKEYHTEKKDHKLFGEKPSDSDISKIHTSIQRSCLRQEETSKRQDALLAYCSYDLSSLLRNVWDYREKAQLHNMEHSNFSMHMESPSSSIKNNDVNCDFWTTYHKATNRVNLAYISKYFKRDSSDLLKEWLLIESNTTLSLEAYLLSPQAATLVLHQIPNTYKRLFLIAFDKKTARDVFTKILKHNQKILCEKLNVDKLLTGWVLDNGNNCAIYVEGLSVGYILNIWLELNDYSVDEVKIFFNTDQAFEQRLYPMCNKWSGFFICSLKVPLEYILKDQRLYIKGNVPPLCLKVLSKLDLLFHTRNLRLMLQYELFPTIEGLESLDIEYGVPHIWKPLERSMSVSMDDSEIIDNFS